MLLVQIGGEGPNTPQLIAMIVGAIAVFGIIGRTAVKIFAPLAQAFARRIGGGGGGGGEERGILDRMDALAQELDQLRGQLAETHERLDFTERLLSRQRAPEQLPRGSR